MAPRAGGASQGTCGAYESRRHPHGIRKRPFRRMDHAGGLALMRVAPGRRAGGASPRHAPPVRQCWPASSGLLAAYAGSAAVTAVAALAGCTRHPAAALAAYGLLAAVIAASTRPAAAVGVALIAWM